MQTITNINKLSVNASVEKTKETQKASTINSILLRHSFDNFSVGTVLAVAVTETVTIGAGNTKTIEFYY
jgi:hypothetical protein